MKFFRDLFFRQAPKNCTQIKFRKSTAWVLPLKLRSFDGISAPANNWQINQLQKNLGEKYVDHLMLSPNNRVNILYYLPPHGRTRKRVIIEKSQTSFHCQSLDKRSPIQHFILGLHDDAVMTLMVIPREGNRLKLCQALCGTQELPDLEQLNHPESVNNFAFNFAANAGADPRGRATLAIRCDNMADINRIESFISAIHELAPFDQPMANLIKQILSQSKNMLPFAIEMDAVLDEEHALTGPGNLFPDYNPRITEKVREVKDKSLEVGKKLAWHIMGDFAIKDQLDLFSGFPNGIPDVQREKNILVHYPETVRTFNDSIPEIHLAILAGDLTQLNHILNQDPMQIYTRDTNGLLPIQLAYQTVQPVLGSVIFTKWMALPKSQQWATRLFVRTANELTDLEFEYSNTLDPNQVMASVQAYFSKQLPMIDQPLALYTAIQQGDNENIARLCQQELAPWETLLNLCQTGDLRRVKKMFAEMLTDKYALFSALLKEDSAALTAALQDFIPDTTLINHSVYFGHADRIAELSEHGLFQTEQEEQHMLQLAAALNAVIKETDQIVAQLNQLANPLAEDQAPFQKLLQEFWALHDKQKQLRAESTVWSEFANRDWKKLIDLHNPTIKFLEKLKTKMRARVKIDGSHVCKEMVLNALAAFKNVELIPHHQLIIAMLNDDITQASTLLQQQLKGKQQTIGSLPKIDNFYHYNTRNSIHQTVLNGQALPIAEFVTENELFLQFKQAMYDLYCSEAHELSSMDQELLTMDEIILIRELHNRVFDMSMKESLKFYINKVACSAEAIDSLKQGFYKTNAKLLNDAQSKLQYFNFFEKILTVKSNTTIHVHTLILQYRQHCKCTDPDIFDVFTLLLAQHQATIVYKAIIKNKIESDVNDLLLSRIKQLSKSKVGTAKASLQTLAECCRNFVDHERIMSSLIRCNLLSFEQQDPWGYTPLLLAVSADRLDIVKAFFENNLASDWIVSFDHEQILFYTLLSHANTRSMLKLVLHYYTNPNTRFTFLKGLERNLAVLLYYHHDQMQPLDTHGLELLDYIAAGLPVDPEDLKELLKHRKSFVQEGPYDPTMPKEIQQVFTTFNAERTKMLERSKAKLAPLNRIDDGIRLQFAEEYYLSKFKTTAQLSAEDRLMLPRLFAECFELPNEQDTNLKTQAFFSEKVLINTRYIYELFYQEHSLIPLAFLCLQLKALHHSEYGDFLCAHLSIAACSFDHAQKGLLTSSMKIILALKQYADEKQIPLKCYSRFARPGVAFALLPDHIDMSTKYHRNEGFVAFVADQFNNKIEPNGTSLPPVRSKSSVSTRGNGRIDAYRFFLNECLGADDKAALPVVMDIDNSFVKELTADLSASADLQAAHIDFIQQQLGTFLQSMELTQNGSPRARL